MLKQSPRSAISRRTALGIAGPGALASAGLLVSARAGLAKANGGTFNLSEPADFLTACLKMRGATDGRLTMGYAAGRYYGVVGDELTHLFDLLAGAFYLHRLRSDGGYDRRYLEVAYFTDPATGDPLTDWTNPYTGRSVQVPPSRLGPTDLVIRKDAHVVSDGFPGMRFRSRHLPAILVEDDVWITQVTEARAPAAAGRPAFTYNELTTAHARQSELADRSAKFVRATTTVNIVVSWRPWLGMGAAPGHMMFTGSGRQTDDLQDLPAKYLELGMSRYPEIFRSPERVLREGWS
jgi:hypothetical protein